MVHGAEGGKRRAKKYRGYHLLLLYVATLLNMDYNEYYKRR